MSQLVITGSLSRRLHVAARTEKAVAETGALAKRLASFLTILLRALSCAVA
jgi:hypothetical protein